MTPSPVPVSAALDATPAQWWEVLGALGPLAILVGAILAAVIGGFTLRQRTKADALALAQKRESDAKALEQKRRADDRSEWWRRAQWALDRALDARPSTKALGLATLEVLARSTLAHAEELELFDIAWASVNDPDNGDWTAPGARADGPYPPLSTSGQPAGSPASMMNTLRLPTVWEKLRMVRGGSGSPEIAWWKERRAERG
jgi:hypothetical protein